MGEQKKAEDSALSLLAKQCVDDSERWFGDTAGHSLPHHALAMAGEVGEFCNLVKKIERGSLRWEDAAVRYKLMMELTDVFVYLLNISGMIGVDLEKSYKHVRTLNDKRFTEERAKREAAKSE